MGLATVVKTEWGYYVTGDTDPTIVWRDGRKYIRTVVFCAATTNDTMELATTKNLGGEPSQVGAAPTGTYTSFLKDASPGAANQASCTWHLDDGVPADNLRITLSNASGRAYIYVR